MNKLMTENLALVPLQMEANLATYIKQQSTLHSYMRITMHVRLISMK